MQGWGGDPFGLHEQRYFSAGHPTKLVRDGGVEAYDEPPAGEFSPGDVAAVTSVSSSAVSREPSALGHAAAPFLGIASPPARRRRADLAYSTVALVAVAAVVAVIAVAGLRGTNGGAKSSGSISSGMSLAAFVTKSASQTLTQHTADISLTGTVNIGGTTVNTHGTGQANFAANAVAMTLSTTVSGTTLVEREIDTGHALYMQLVVNGRSMSQYFGGRDWLEIPVASSPSDAEPQDSAISLLRLLERQGARTAQLGTQNIGGVNCTEVAVTPTMQALLAAMQQESASDGLSKSEAAAAQSLLKNSAPPSLIVWFDPKRDLTCQLFVYLQLGLGLPSGSGSLPSTATTQVLMTFTHYGVPVTIMPPAESDTFSIVTAQGGAA
jgi:hypothetical protein